MPNPHGLDMKWQVLLINLYCHVMVVGVRADSSLSLLWTCPEEGAELGGWRVGRAHRTHQVSSCFTLCVLPQVVSLKALKQQQGMDPRALPAPLAPAWAIKPRLFLVRRDQVSSLMFQLSLCWSRWRM